MASQQPHRSVRVRPALLLVPQGMNMVSGRVPMPGNLLEFLASLVTLSFDGLFVMLCLAAEDKLQVSVQIISRKRGKYLSTFRRVPVSTFFRLDVRLKKMIKMIQSSGCPP